jgi:alkanesulfonate monooxygenase SsuD/methylene tetrahydromethanopterin reductase-like flavin-dependent oxidoreductase (luciferase family)
MDVSITVEGSAGLNWDNWPKLMVAVENGGFGGLFRADHFITPGAPPFPDSLEMVVSLTYAADHTERVHLGTLVTPLSFRDPRHLVRQAAAIDDLSGGRLVLGLGAGWMVEEHEMFGYELGDIATRMDRFEEGLQIITGLLRSDEPLSLDGDFFRLKEAVLKPRPRRPGGPRILIGGNGMNRTLPLVARYADVWNGVSLDADDWHERNRRLDDLLVQEGRQPGDVKRTMMLFAAVGRDDAELNQSLAWLRGPLGMEDASLAAVEQAVRGVWPNYVYGSPQALVERLQEYAELGVEEVMIQKGPTDIDGVRLIAEEVLPHVRG